MKHLPGLVVCTLALGLLACAQPLTEVLIVVDTDFAIPSELDAINVEVMDPIGTPRAMGPLRSQRDLPATVGVLHSGGALGPVSVEVRGSISGVVVVQREATFSFVENETRILRINLLRSCRGVTCMAGLTCGENGCRSAQLSAADLEPYQEDLGRIDAGTPGDDAGRDAGTDAGQDASVDAGTDAGSDAGPDASIDAGMDAGSDAGTDAGSDAGTDAGSGDPPCVGLPAMCGTGGARCICNDCTCDATCSASCEVECIDSDRCDTDGAGTSNVDVECTNSTCAIDASGASNVTVVASMGADVEVDCSGSSSCDVECTGGSSCLVRCVAASSCDISMCATAVTTCPMLIRVCGRACP